MVILTIVGFLGATLVLTWVAVVLWLILDIFLAMFTNSLVAIVVDFWIINRGSFLGLYIMLLTVIIFWDPEFQVFRFGNYKLYPLVKEFSATLVFLLYYPPALRTTSSNLCTPYHLQKKG